MDSYFKGPLWLAVALLTLPRLSCATDCPSRCLCDGGVVKCAGRSFTEIPRELPDHTYTLIIVSTNVSIIAGQSLADQDLLLRFSLTKSHLHTIDPLAFHVAPQLKSIKLSSNNLTTLPDRVFSALTTLEQLYLDDNNLETIAPDTFRGLAGLQVLDLNQNLLDNPPSDVFDGLSNLTFLNLGRNYITRLPPTVFRPLTKLRQLLIYNNELEALEAGTFDELVNLQELKIHQNQIESLPPRVFWSLKNLRSLTLSSNRLKVIPEKSFYHMPKLSKLTIYKNPLLALPDQLMGHMPEMVEFYLYGTNLTTVPGNVFANMSGLLRLNLHINDHLRELPSDLFCCLPNLQKLSLKNNSLHYLHPQLFSRLTRLNVLFLNDNKIQNLSGNIFQGLERLVDMDLKNNHLKSLPGNIFSSNAGLMGVTLSGNPWECTCSIRHFATWMRNNGGVILDKEDVICRIPGSHLFRVIGSLRDVEFKLCDAKYISPTTHNPMNGPTPPFHSIPTSGEKSVSKAATTSNTIEEATRQVTPPATTPTTDATTLTAPLLTSPAALPYEEFLPTTETHLTKGTSTVFYDLLVIEQRPEFVHHNRHRGWVYLWLLPSGTAWAGYLMFCHVLLVTTGLFLILASMYGMCRLNKTMDKLTAEYAHNDKNVLSG